LTDAAPDPLRIRRLLDSGRALVADLDPQAVLVRTLAVAREVTGASYEALGVLDEQRAELEQFLTLGIDGQTPAATGALPRMRVLLGTPIDDPVPQRLTEIAADVGADGFSTGHPPPAMRSFLGVPILIGDTSWGGLYLTERQDKGRSTLRRPG
jgi:GAF domain-containing protein